MIAVAIFRRHSRVLRGTVARMIATEGASHVIQRGGRQAVIIRRPVIR